CFGDECLHFDGFGHVGPDEGGFPTLFRDHMDSLLSTVFVRVSHHQSRPFPSKRQGCGSPNPLPASRPQRDFTFYTSRHGDLSCVYLSPSTLCRCSTTFRCKECHVPHTTLWQSLVALHHDTDTNRQPAHTTVPGL